MARHNATTLVDPFEEPLNLILVAVQIRAKANWLTPDPAGRHVRPDIQMLRGA